MEKLLNLRLNKQNWKNQIQFATSEQLPNNSSM